METLCERAWESKDTEANGRTPAAAAAGTMAAAAAAAAAYSGCCFYTASSTALSPQPGQSITEGEDVHICPGGLILQGKLFPWLSLLNSKTIPV